MEVWNHFLYPLNTPSSKCFEIYVELTNLSGLSYKGATSKSLLFVPGGKQ
jgi:hypothetical protein